MMNNTHCTAANVFHRELRFGSWLVSVDRSPKRIARQITDFAIGLRWAGLGVLAALAAIAATAL